MDRLRPPSPAARSQRRVAVVAAMVLAATIGVEVPAAAMPQGAAGGGDPAAARELYKKGRKAYDDGNMREAYEAYSAAWKIQKSFDIAGNLAGVEMETARYRDAADHLRFALANLPVSGDADKRRARLETLLRDAKRQIGTLVIKVTPDAAQVTLDGRVLTRAELADEVFVDPGDHVLAATAPDHVPAEQKVKVGKGSFQPVSMALAKGAPVVAGAGPAPGPSPITVAGFIVSGIGLATGTALAIVSKIKADTANSQFEALEARGGANACRGASPSDACVTLRDARASRDGFANAALWTFVGAAAVAGGTLAYTLIVPRGGPKPPAGVSALPVVSPQGGGLFVTGSF